MIQDPDYGISRYFRPFYYMSDMPLTEKVLAERCLEAAREEGLENVRIGNTQYEALHLRHRTLASLGDDAQFTSYLIVMVTRNY